MTGPEDAQQTGLPHPPPRPRRRWLRWAALGASLAVLAAGGAAWALYNRLDGNIRTDTEAVDQLRRFDRERPAAVVHEAKNILLIGSDDRSGDNGRYGRDSGTQRSDTTILLHLSADRSSATGVSIPRDLMVDIPECPGPDGTKSGPLFAQFNWAYEMGGAACTIRTVENLTGIRVDHHLIVDFTGFEKLVDAVGGVEVCLAEPVNDPEAHLVLDAGPQRLDGEQALGYVRARKGIGDGSDTQRMERQQEFLAAMLSQVRDDGLLTDPAELYRVLDAVTSSLTADPGLDSLPELYDLVSGVRGIPEERVRFMTVPRRPYTYNPNRDELVQPDADLLFEALREDRPVPEEGLPPSGSPSAGPSGGPSAGAGIPASDAGTGAPEPSGPSAGSPTGSPSGSPSAGESSDSAAESLCG
ncbi:LCP family protein [Streptomyces fenghuangensis]|uniref:LCP family protein n=2 Tax=Streptomyces TaxID=1883 RepID=A0ABW7HSK8_9ACTN|nr:LCP family protein [Streptomyces chitinivorans]MDH2411330.1 LCP family protein [Streptomyces chitinivorans]